MHLSPQVQQTSKLAAHCANTISDMVQDQADPVERSGLWCFYSTLLIINLGARVLAHYKKSGKRKAVGVLILEEMKKSAREYDRKKIVCRVVRRKKAEQKLKL